MSGMGTPRTVNMLRALSLVLGLLALAGWGTYAYAAKSSTAAQQRLSEQVGELKVREGRLLAERDEAMSQFSAARDEVVALRKQLDEAQAKAAQTGSVRPPASSGSPARS